ncbi:MAG: plasmid pRiA4b ORF-3 family protein [Proteobacteria bacterium]|nr:plasmid pRiA4b ORF-3 family protein [Pseudomonadota bacterium]
MAQVIQGVFPKTIAKEATKDDKPVVSYILHISILFSDPLIWRRVQVPGTFTLSQLHDVIQQSMGWSDSHVHQFLVGKICYEPTRKSTHLRESKRFDENKYKLYMLEEDMGFMFTYLYGAGESWEHEIHLEEVVPPTGELKQPIIIAGERACPPETVGDIHEYQALLTALETPGHKNHKRLFELTNGQNFDPSFFDLETAKKRVDARY